VEVFRSLIKETRWWKYRQEYRRMSARKRSASPPIQTVRLETPQAHSLATRVYQKIARRAFQHEKPRRANLPMIDKG